MNWFELGKPRSKLGEYIDSKGISQQELSDKTGVNRNTIGQLANDEHDQVGKANEELWIIYAIMMTMLQVMTGGGNNSWCAVGYQKK